MKTASPLNLEKILNPEQYQSATSIHGPSLILAGAGSGKTRVITYKIAYLINQGIAPSRILAVTFTNKAAKEMKERVGQLIGQKSRNVTISTFHSLGLRILEKNIERLGYKRKFSIYDDQDRQKLLKDAIGELKIPQDEYDVYELSYKISRLKMNPEYLITDPQVTRIFKRYQELLKIYNAVDFDDLIKLPIQLFEENPDVLDYYHRKWQYLLVDEYQDTSFMQYRFMKLLAEKNRNISVVGDDDQSIYSWRGADVSNIKQFEKDFHPVFTVKLEQNYRSTANILNAANAVIQTNPNRYEKKLWTSDQSGEKISFYEAQSEEEEAQYVLMMINQLKNQGYKYSDFAILFRMNSQSRPFEEILRENNVPYKISGAMKFFDRPEIRDILSYMRFLANTDDEVALMRIINNPKRGIGAATLTRLMEYAKEHHGSIYAALKDFIHLNIAGDRITPYLEEFDKLIEKHRELIFKPKNIARAVTSLVEAIDYKGKLVSELKNIRKITMRMNNITQLVASISRYEKDPDNFNPNIYEYLQRVTLNNRDDDEEEGKGVNMLSIHAAKGLEYKVVFLVGVEDGLIPHFKTVEETGSDEEERRLFYVAITRAQKKLFMTYPKTRLKFNETLHREPSSFLTEIPEELMDARDLEEKLAERDTFNDLLSKWKEK
ncbi:MAG: UvrD-helicase domain-containing protein [Spirochaetes bacterium]|nr:UvrD-helicase domain-containing protein [Spirochaetota bacterium]